MQEEWTFNNRMKLKKNNKSHPEGEKKAARQKTGTQSNITHIGRKTTDQHRTTDTRR